jgi:hypothetical protein
LSNLIENPIEKLGTSILDSTQGYVGFKNRKLTEEETKQKISKNRGFNCKKEHF